MSPMTFKNMQSRERPAYLRGYANGERVHAVQTLPPERDPHPTQHGHAPRKAICGTFVAVKPVAWARSTPRACERCRKIAR